MSKISTYPSADTPLLLSDRLIGTEAFRPVPSPTPLATKNFSLGELLQLFSANFPAASLQAVLDTGNTATQNITLTGTINTTLIKPVNIEDTSGSQGTTFQFLSKGTSSINWINLPVDNLQAVLNAGNTATQNITLIGNITSTKIIPGNIQDDTAGIGTVGQVLSKTSTGIRWITNPAIYTAGLADVLSIGNTATNNITLIGNINATNAHITGAIYDSNNSPGIAGQVLSSTATGTDWIDANTSTPTLNQVLTAGNTSILAAKIGLLYGYDNVNSDYGTLEFYDSGIVIKAATTNHFLFYNDDSGTVKFSNGTYTPTLNFAGVGNNVYTFQNSNGTLAFLSDIPSLTGYVPTSRTISTTSPLQGGGDLTANRTLSILQSSSTQNGYLSSADWSTFNGKQNAISLTTTGSSGSSTLVGSTLNIPTYTLAGLGGISLTSLSSTATGLTYTNTTGVFSLTSGYLIPTTASYNNTNWDTAYANRITSLTTIGTGAATLISNVLNIPTPSLSGYVPYTGATTDLNLGSNNLIVNNIFDGFSSVVASASLITLTVASVPSYLVTGSGGQTFKMPNATTIPNGALYTFNNNQSSGAILVNNNSNTLIKSVPSGGNMILELLDNSTAAGSWDTHFQAPSNVSWSTNTFDYAGSITSATWNGVSIADNRIASSANWNTAYTNRITSLTTTGTGAATLISNVLNIPTPPTATFTSLTTTGSSGSSTLTSGVLNVPTYTLSGLGGQPLATNLTSLSGLTYASTSFVKMTAAGTFALDTNTYLTGNQSITLSGDISGTGTTAITTAIGANKVTNSMLAQVATATFKGRTTASTGNVEDLTVTQATALLDTFSSTLKGLVPASGGGTTNFLRADGTWAAPSGGLGTVTSVAALTLGTTGTDLSSTVANSTTTPVITLNVPTASATNRGALSSTDWSTFNNKQGAITLTTTGTSGAATLVGNTLNIPQYSGGGGGSTPVKLTSQTLAVGSWTLSGGYYTYAFSNVNVDTTCDVSVTPQNASYLTAYNAQVLPFVGVAAGVATFYSQFPPQADMVVDIVITQTT